MDDRAAEISHRLIYVFYLPVTDLFLANWGSDCDPYGGPQKVIVQSKNGLTFGYINVRLV